ncbi:MAG: F0F1 ATP synthase subunit A [Opitutales bacterium]|nr:F0F1 ATP synthase subunit A [Opitutales bacterium]MDG1326669.1 F0F1 ATP synthase subunit A [Opitutales bacterium]
MKLLTPFFFLFTTLPVFASGEGVSLVSEEIFKLGVFPVTNSMVTSWVVSIVIVILVKLLVGRTSLIPSKGQLIVESAITSLRTMLEPIVGKKVFFPSFWLLSGLFIFILIHNWSGLLPGVGTIGQGIQDGSHFKITKPLIRPGNADLNMTLALALVANICWIYFIVKYAGLKAIIKDWFGNKADKTQVNFLIFGLLGILFIAVGFIEVLSILFRPVSLTFRLFGNVYGGESLLHSMFYLGESLKLNETLINISMAIAPIPFYFMEVLIGLVQAMVFMLLVSVYIGLICNHEEENH